jgi:AraC-like DNA-binding protein
VLESISPRPHVSIDAISPRVDFACCWQVDSERRYTYRVPSHQFLLVESGSLQARTARGGLHAKAGDLLCLKREPRTQYGFSGRTCFWESHMAFAPPPIQATPLWLEGEPLPDLIPLGDHAESARGCFETMCVELDRPGDLHRLRVLGAVHQLLAAIAAALGREPSRRPKSDPWQRARARLEGDLRRTMRLGDVAAELGVGEDHFIRGFRRRFGISPMAYRQQAKLRAASALLASGGRAVKEVARQLGFTDASAFARAFRRQFGLAPTDLRIAGPSGLPQPLAVAGELPHPVNRHIRPPGAPTKWFTWG